jgi:hypothetical protein
MPELREDVWYEECSTCRGHGITSQWACRDCEALGYVEHDQEAHMVGNDTGTHVFLMRNEKYVLDTVQVGPETAAAINRSEYSEPSAAVRLPVGVGLDLRWNELRFDFVQSDN